jgi:dTDP-4-dehydrorhamnose 3,5-epimerase
MIFTPTSVRGVVLITRDCFADDRGFFARTWDTREFESHGLNPRVVERNLSGNRTAATLRGLHYQRPPHAQAKVVACVTGAIYDVVVDIRPESPTYRQWFATELAADTGSMLYIPEGCAHGFETLHPDSLVEYLMSDFFAPDFSTGVRWDDPAFGIFWPMPPEVVSPRDRSWPNFDTV